MLAASKLLRRLFERPPLHRRTTPDVTSASGPYCEEFTQALLQTSRLGLNCDTPYVFSATNCIEIEKIAPVLQHLLGEYTADQVAAQCIAVNYKMKPVLEEKLGIPLYLTFGWYEHVGARVYEHDERLLTSLLKGHAVDFQVAGLPIHCWLTSPACEVLDVTLPTTIALVAPQHRHLVGGVYYFADTHARPEVIYHPTVVGQDFLLSISS